MAIFRQILVIYCLLQKGLIYTIILYNFIDILKTIGAIYNRLGQVEACMDWCASKGYLITFDIEEQIYCKMNCFLMAIIPPPLALICNILRQYLGDDRRWFIENERCIIVIVVNKLDVTGTVKKLMALEFIDKVKSYFIW